MISIFNGATRGLASAHEASTYVQVHHSILKHMKEFTASEWMVFTALALHMDTNGFCFPSLDGISRMTGLSESTVRRCLQSLQEVKLEGRRVLAVRTRFQENGRQTSNGYVLFPDCQEGGMEGVKNDTGEGVNFGSGEGVKNDTPINNKKKEQESDLTTKVKGKTSVKLPALDDPGRLLYEAYRSVAYPELMPSDFNLAEWLGVRHIVYQMNHKGIDVRTVEMATNMLIRKWGGNRDRVTLHALWKHWSTATTGAVVPQTNMKTAATAQEIGQSAAEIFRRIRGEG
jgi:hypothetical protein